MKKIILLVIVNSIFHFCFAGEKYSRAKIWFDGKSAMDLGKVGIDLTEGEYQKDLWFISDFSEDEISRIHSAGFRTDILIADVQSFYINRNKIAARKMAQTSSACVTQSPHYPVPAHFYLGSMGGFFTYSQLLNILDSMALLYPNLISVKQPIDSVNTIQGRPIYFVKISDNPNVDENEPEVLYTALHHAREPESLSQLIYYMWYLLENYNTDESIRELINNTEMYFVPCVNPDGYTYNEATNPQGAGFWRKNRRDNLDGTFGVDLNRNYEFKWGYDDMGSSISTSSETYRGTYAFSEPETRALRDFAINHTFKLNLNYHTFGNHNIVPWGYIPDYLTPDSVIFDTFAHAITRFNNYHVGTANRTVNYLVNGDSDDWMYGYQLSKPKIFAMTPEVGGMSDGFWPSIDRIIPLSQINVYANLTMAKLAGHYGEISHNNQTYISQLNSEFHFSFTQLGLDTIGSFTFSITPISSNIISTGSPRTYTNLNLMQVINDSIEINLDPSVSQSESIKFKINVDNGLYITSDTVNLIYGMPVTLLSDDGSNLSHWNYSLGTWGITTEDYVSPPYSITDSPHGLYMSSTESPLFTSDFIDLSNAIDARLTFYAKWNTQGGYDYVQVLASADNGNQWTALCGKYSVEGSAAEAPGEPVYDGLRNNWVSEEMSLNDFLGQLILIKFDIISDDFLELDGFYFDDLKIESLQNPDGIKSEKSSNLFVSKAIPNPSSTEILIDYSNAASGTKLNVFNTFGQIVFEENIFDVSGKIILPVNQFADGLYSYRLTLPDGSHSAALKFVVSK